MGMEIQRIFADDKKNRLISLVKEPLAPGWAAMMHALRYPYAERFDYIMRRLLEAGLMDLWKRDVTKDYLSSVEVNRTTDVHLKNYASNNENEFSSLKIIFSLAIGYSISFVIFVFEIVWPCFKMKRTVIQIFDKSI